MNDFRGRTYKPLMKSPNIRTKVPKKAQRDLRQMFTPDEQWFVDLDAASAIVGDESVGVIVEGDMVSPHLATLDIALGGGFVTGCVELYGEESVGKTALIGQILAAAQHEGRDVALVSSEYLDVPYLERLGVDTNRLFRFPASLNGDRMVDATAKLALGFVRIPGNVLAVDSLTAWRQKGQNDEEWNAWAYSLLSDFRDAASSRSFVFCTSQVRTRFAGAFPTMATKSSSKRLEDLFDVRLRIERHEVSDLSYRMSLSIESNVASSPFKLLELPATKGMGVNRGLALLEAAEAVGVLERRGAFLYFDDQLLGHGSVTAARLLEKNEEVFLSVYRRTVR